MRIRESTRVRCNPCRGILIAAVAATGFALPLVTAGGQEPVVEEEEAVVVGEEESVVIEEGSSRADSGWKARKITLRPVGDKPAFIRHSSDAFDDPDQQMSLELKYYFDLPAEMADAIPAPGLLNRGPKPAEGTQLTAGPATSSEEAAALPHALDAPQSPSKFDIEWIDYQAGASPKIVAAILPAGESLAAPLIVARVAANERGLEIQKQTAKRELSAGELPEGCLPGGLLDTWDRPKSLGGRAMFFGRVIAVLKLVDDRYAVDFYGEALHPDSDCRVWLWKAGSAMGRPVAIRFVEIPVKKGSDSVGLVWSLAVTSQMADDALHTIAFDYPLCRPAIMAQLQRATQNSPDSAAPDLEKLVGADLLDEFARRLVNGTYR